MHTLSVISLAQPSSTTEASNHFVLILSLSLSLFSSPTHYLYSVFFHIVQNNPSEASNFPYKFLLCLKWLLHKNFQAWDIQLEKWVCSKVHGFFCFSWLSFPLLVSGFITVMVQSSLLSSWKHLHLFLDFTQPSFPFKLLRMETELVQAANSDARLNLFIFFLIKFPSSELYS